MLSFQDRLKSFLASKLVNMNFRECPCNIPGQGEGEALVEAMEKALC